MNKYFLVLFGLTTITAGCAAPKSVHGETSALPNRDQEALVQYERQISEFQNELNGSLQATAKPDCDRACDLLNNICILSKKICLIAQRHSGAQKLMIKCRDGCQSCSRAQIRVSDLCKCTNPQTQHCKQLDF
ncbi:MAG: hypothetical protein JRJ87_21205 [Deltaproteobacteria bacterium]|nr:hypothetical protein [Deltaproteobacteria bacterium]